MYTISIYVFIQLIIFVYDLSMYHPSPLAVKEMPDVPALSGWSFSDAFRKARPISLAVALLRMPRSS